MEKENVESIINLNVKNVTMEETMEMLDKEDNVKPKRKNRKFSFSFHFAQGGTTKIEGNCIIDLNVSKCFEEQ